MENFVREFAWEIVCLLLGSFVLMAVGVMIGWLFHKKKWADHQKQLDDLRKRQQTFNFNVTANIGEKNVRAGIIRGSFTLGYMIILGRQSPVFIPSAYFEQPDGSRVPLDFEGFDIPDGVEEAGSFGINVITEPDPKKRQKDE